VEDAKCIELAVSEGFAEIEAGRKNICYPPSTDSCPGVKLSRGIEASRPDTIVVVNTSQAGSFHAILENSSYYSGCRCAHWGAALW
jgi:hypothetical protein